METKNKDELSLQDILGKFKPFVSYFLAKWYWFFLVGLIFGGYGYMKAYTAKPQYKGSLTFILSTDAKSGGSGGLAGLAGQYLLDMGGSSNGGGDVFKGETLLDYMNSYSVIKRVLFKPLNGPDKVFVNYFVKELQLEKKWEGIPRTAHAFPFPDSPEHMTPVQDSLLREIHVIVTKDYLDILRPSKKLSFYEASTTSSNQIIAANLPRYLVDETARLYIITQTKQAQDNLNMLKHEADTLGRVLSSSIQNVGNSIDETYNLNPAFQSQRSGTQRQQVNVSVFTAAYSEVLRNLELAKISLQKEKPLFQIIDEPPALLKIIKGGRIKAGLLWAFIAEVIFFVFLLMLYLRNWVKKNRKTSFS